MEKQDNEEYHKLIKFALDKSGLKWEWNSNLGSYYINIPESYLLGDVFIVLYLSSDGINLCIIVRPIMDGLPVDWFVYEISDGAWFQREMIDRVISYSVDNIVNTTKAENGNKDLDRLLKESYGIRIPRIEIDNPPTFNYGYYLDLIEHKFEPICKNVKKLVHQILLHKYISIDLYQCYIHQDGLDDLIANNRDEFVEKFLPF